MEQDFQVAPEDPQPPAEVDPKRQAMLDRMAKARAAAAAKRAATPVEARQPRKRLKKTFRRLQMEAENKPAAPPAGWLNGISAQGCPPACIPEKCAITGENVCGHPYMGGLQAKYLSGAYRDVIDRYGAAKLEIARLAAEKKVK